MGTTYYGSAYVREIQIPALVTECLKINVKLAGILGSGMTGVQCHTPNGFKTGHSAKRDFVECYGQAAILMQQVATMMEGSVTSAIVRNTLYM